MLIISSPKYAYNIIILIVNTNKYFNHIYNFIYIVLMIIIIFLKNINL